MGTRHLQKARMKLIKGKRPEEEAPTSHNISRGIGLSEDGTKMVKGWYVHDDDGSVYWVPDE